MGCDLSPAMLAVAMAKPPVDDGATIEYREAPAERLPVAGRRSPTARSTSSRASRVSSSSRIARAP
jgi:ubiquinone/menaquinone biosynthesis C-methylase UbiE